MLMTDFEKGLVSIVTPVYNGEKYIHILLESVLKQTYDRVQMIVADDGSTDRTKEIAETFRPRFVERGYIFDVVAGEHLCAAGAMCNGLPLVRGEFLIWPDGDDEIMPESIAKRVAFLNENASVNCVRSNRIYVDSETGKEVKALERTGNLAAHNIFLELLKGETYVCCGCYMLRSKQFFEIYPEGKIPVYGVGQNFQMLLPFMYKYDCHSLNEPLYKVNRRADSHSARQLTKEEEYKKYKDYEDLLDDVIRIANIVDTYTLSVIDGWKYGRQKELFERHKDRESLKKCYRSAYRRRQISLGDYLFRQFGLSAAGRFFMKVINKLNRIRMNLRVENRNRFLAKQKKKLTIANPCVVSNNCVGGAILHDLGLQFLSPFVNLLIMPADYIKMLKSLPEYMASELRFFRQDGIEYPIAKLKDITVHFIHYNTEEDARLKWYERVARMDYNHLYILFSDRDGATKDDIEEFDKLPYKHKVVLVNKPTPNIKSAVYLKGYEKDKEIGMLIAYKNKFSYRKKYDDFDYVRWLNGEI